MTAKSMTTARICFHGTVVLPDRLVPDSFVVCEGDRIASIEGRQPKGLPTIDGQYIAPGYVDLHVHGGAGADYMDGTPEAIRTAGRAHLRHGTTTVFPTTTTGSTEELRRMLNACMDVRDNWSVSDGARIAGVHYYGPYFAPNKVGCHSREGRRDPERAEYEEFLRLGIIRIATCAAELPGAEAFYRYATRKNCLVTCGHSDSTWTEMARAFRAGVRHVDHFWCAMSSVASLRARYGTPMRASMEQFVLATPDMSTEVIADGAHLSPELLDFAFRMKGADRLCLVTDANRALDMPPGQYRFGPDHTGSWFESDGTVGFVPGSGLASSVFALDTMVRNMKVGTSASLPEVIRMASLTPAERAGIARETGSLEKGKFADIVVLNRRLAVQRVFVSGQEFRPTTESSSGGGRRTKQATARP